MDGHGKRVLVVDDDHHARFLLTALLEHAGYTVVSACDGRAALIELHEGHFDAVVTDYRMPVLNGIELLRQIHIYYPQLPVILASGTFPDSDEHFLDCQPFGRLRKPYDNHLLLGLVRSAVDRRHVDCEGAAKYQPITGVRSDGLRPIAVGRQTSAARK
jgi:CheY-like chemotaxis protein